MHAVFNGFPTVIIMLYLYPLLSLVLYSSSVVKVLKCDSFCSTVKKKQIGKMQITLNLILGNCSNSGG